MNFFFLNVYYFFPNKMAVCYTSVSKPFGMRLHHTFFHHTVTHLLQYQTPGSEMSGATDTAQCHWILIGKRKALA